MNHLKSLLVISLLAGLTIVSCKKHEATTSENLTAEWNSTAIKIDGVAATSTSKMFLHLQSSQKYEISTTLTPFTHPKSGAWSVNTAGDKLTLSGNAWTIHHLDGNTLRIVFIVDGKELEIDFSK